MIETHILIARYLYWFFGIVAASYLLQFISGLFLAAGVIAALAVPTDRVRRYMIRHYEHVPEPKQAWTLILALSFLPFCFGIYSMSVIEVPEGMYRANTIVSGVLFWGMLTFGLNSLLYRNNKIWLRARSRLNTSNRTEGSC